MSIEYVVMFALISGTGVILAAILNVLNFTRAQKNDSKEEASALASSLATMSTTLEHIEASVACSRQDLRDLRSEMSTNMKDIKQDIKEHRDMIVQAREAAKSAHKRLDELIGRQANSSHD